MKATVWGWVAAAAALAGCNGTVTTAVGGTSAGTGGATTTTTVATTTTGTSTDTTTVTSTDTTTVTDAPPPLACPTNAEKIAVWQIAGATPAKYQMGQDPATSCNGEPSLFLQSSTASVSGDFGTLMRIRSGGQFAGVRVRLRGSIKTDAVTGWAGLWMRVDGAQKNVLAFDNMMNRAVTGTTDWTSYDVVLDVAPSAVDIAYGILLSNEGSVWLDGVSVEMVDNTVPTTG